MNLVKIAQKFNAGIYPTPDRLTEDLNSINIYEPNIDADELEDVVFSVGDGNSWLEVFQLVKDGEMTKAGYKIFASEVKARNLPVVQ